MAVDEDRGRDGREFDRLSMVGGLLSVDKAVWAGCFAKGDESTVLLLRREGTTSRLTDRTALLPVTGGEAFSGAFSADREAWRRVGINRCRCKLGKRGME